MTKTFSPTRSRSRGGVALAAAGLALTAAPAGAVAIGPTTLSAFAEVGAFSAGASDSETLTIDNGAPDPSIQAGVLLTNVGRGGRPPLAPPGVSDSFANAQVRGDGRYGVGAGAFAFEPIASDASVSYIRRFTNDAATPVDVFANFFINEMTVGLESLPFQRQISAFAQAQGSYTVLDEVGTVRESSTLFDVFIDMQPNVTVVDSTTGIVTTLRALMDFSDDLLSRSFFDDLDLVEVRDPTSSAVLQYFTVPEHQWGLNFRMLPPEWTLEVELFGAAIADVGIDGVEGSVIALVGDPFDLSAEPGGPIEILEVAFAPDGGGAPTPIPAPAAAWLLGSGLLGLVFVRRRRPRPIPEDLPPLRLPRGRRRHRVEAVPTEGMAAREAAQRQPEAAERAMPLESLQRVA